MEGVKNAVTFDVAFELLDQTFDADMDVTVTTETGGGTTDHRALVHRDAADAHPMSAITGLLFELDGKLADVPALSNREIEQLLKNQL